MKFSTPSGANVYGFALAILLALPMLWFNVRGSQHWGDDFAVYIQQTINIAEGRVYYASGYMYVPGFTSSVPEAPVGFSLLLLPVYKIFGFNMYAFSFYLAAFFAAWMLTAYGFLRRYFGIATSLIILLIAFYPNFMFWLKLLITADVPFALLLLAIVMLHTKASNSVKLSIVTGLLTGFAMQMRSIGLLMLVAVWLFAVYGFARAYWRKQPLNIKNVLLPLITYTTAALLIYVSFSYVLFKPNQEYVSTSLENWQLQQIPRYIKFNLTNYRNSYLELFTGTAANLKSVSVVFSYAMLILTIAGFVIRVLREVEVFDILVVCYVCFLLVIPINADYRYIAPIHPFLILYLFTSLRFTLQKLSGRYLWIFKTGFTVFIITLFYDHLDYLWHDTKNVAPGPYSEASQLTFDFIKRNVDDTDIVVFTKPRALALYTGKHTTMHNWDFTAEQNAEGLRKLSPRYYMFSDGTADKAYKELIDYKMAAFKKIYNNWEYIIYEDTTIAGR